MNDSLYNNIFLCSMECPLEESIGSCVFKPIRDIEQIERQIKYIEGLNGFEKLEIFLKHKECLHKRNSELVTQNV